MKTQCHTVRQGISGWLALEASEKDAVRAHTEGCEGCRADLDQVLLALQPLSATRQGYLGLRYAGKRPDFSENRPTKQARWWAGGGFRSWTLSPFPVALATAVFSLSLLLYFSSHPGSIRTEPQAIRPPADVVPESRSGEEESAPSETVSPSEPVSPSGPVPPAETVPPSETVPPEEAESLVETVPPPETVTPAETGTPDPRPIEGAEITATPAASLAAIRRRAQAVGRASLPERPAGFSFKIPPRPASPKRPVAGGGS